MPPRRVHQEIAAMRCLVTLLCAVLAGLTVPSVRAAKNDWAEGTPGKSNGASRDYYNSAASLPWKNRMGDWRDAKDQEQGDVPYARAEIGAGKERFVEWDVTSLVR